MERQNTKRPKIMQNHEYLTKTDSMHEKKPFLPPFLFFMIKEDLFASFKAHPSCLTYKFYCSPFFPGYAAAFGYGWHHTKSKECWIESITMHNVVVVYSYSHGRKGVKVVYLDSLDLDYSKIQSDKI